MFFYSHNTGEFRCFSNFYPANFTDPDTGITYINTEQYLMHAKALTFNDPITAKKILKANSAATIKSLGRKVENYDDKVWSSVRYQIMVAGLKLKFSQNLDLQKILLSTDDQPLYEASKNDKIWGIGFTAAEAQSTSSTQFGTNLLGLALMETRKILAE